MASHILLYFFVIVTCLVFIASADGDGGYKLLDYGEESPAHPWLNIVQRARIPRIQRRQNAGMGRDYRLRNEWISPNSDPRFNRTEDKRKSSVEETNEHNNFRKDSGVKVIYSRVPMPFILVSSYPKPKH